jgi:hypothetical protein
LANGIKCSKKGLGRDALGRTSWDVRKHRLGLRVGPDTGISSSGELTRGSTALNTSRSRDSLRMSHQRCQGSVMRRVRKVCERVLLPAAAAGLVTFGGLSTVTAVRRRTSKIMAEVGTPLL